MKLDEFLKVANWPMVVYMSLVHATAALGVYYITSVHWQTLVWGFICYVIAGVGITGMLAV